MNIRGLIPQTVPTKVPYIEDILDETALAFALTETWLNESHLEAEMKINGYTLFKEDRKRARSRRGRSSGGVGIYIRDDFALLTENVFNFGNKVIESTGVHIRSLNLIIIVTYRSPDDTSRKITSHRSTYKEFLAFLSELRKFLSDLSSPTPDILLLGDFNLPHADWITGECSPGASTDEQNMVRKLYELTIEHFLVQQLDQPTHRDGNLLDLVFTNNAQLIHDLNVVPSAKSDHHHIQFTVSYSATDTGEFEGESVNSAGETPSFSQLNFFDDSIDWNGMENDLQNHNWSREFRGLNTTTMMEHFNSVCYSIASKWIPKRKQPPGVTTKRRIPRHRKALMRKRTRLNKQLITSTSLIKKDAVLRKLIDVEKLLTKSHEEQREFEERKAIEKIKVNPKFFFSFGRKFSKVKIGVGPLINAAKKLISTPLEMAELLSEQYSSVFSTPLQNNIDIGALFPDNEYSDSCLYNMTFCDSELEEAMNELAPNAAPGPDRFPAILLKKCRKALAPPLSTIWRESLKTGEIPDICKSATITPIHKGKSRAVPKNYRPVALTSHLIKVFEKVVRNKLVQFLSERNLFNTTQHGFLAGRSCLSQLLSHFDWLTTELESGNGVDIVYLDFAKAFDKVDHGVTLQKISNLGIKGHLGRWIYSFLTNRHQSVVVQGRKSQPRTVKSGVPQGSVLGPLLFLVLIGDINKDVAASYLSSFADDTRVGKAITSEDDVKLLQADLESIYRWSTENNMLFNSDKFELLRYKSKDTKTVQMNTNYCSDNGQVIEEKKHVRDLGITMSNDATFSAHIQEKCNAIKSKIAWVLRTFRSRESLPMLTLWKTQIMCHLDYCSQLWSPSKTGSIQSLELLQKAFFNRINGMQSLNYWDQLSRLKSFSLERRRERYQIIYIWRMIEGQVPNFVCTPVETYMNSRRGRLCKVPAVSTSAPSTVQTIRLSSLPFRGPRLFNCLPKILRSLTKCDTPTFKRELDKFLATVPDQPLIPGLTKYRKVESNSLVDWINSPYLREQNMQCQPRHRSGTDRGSYDVMT